MAQATGAGMPIWGESQARSNQKNFLRKVTGTRAWRMGRIYRYGESEDSPVIRMEWEL